HILRCLDQQDPAAVGGIELPHRAFHLRMALVANQHHIATLARVAHHFHVNLRHQWAGGIEHFQLAPPCLVLHHTRDAMGAEYHRGMIRHLIQFLDEHGAETAQALDDIAVVHHLVPYIDRSAEQLDGALDNVDGAIDAGAEASRISEQDAHDEIVG